MKDKTKCEAQQRLLSGTMVHGCLGGAPLAAVQAAVTAYINPHIIDLSSIVIHLVVQVKSGAVPAVLATEGVLLQYAVDCKLDELLGAVYVKLTAPPLAVNPYPQLIHALRAQSARMELWRHDADEAAEFLLNDLVRRARFTRGCFCLDLLRCGRRGLGWSCDGMTRTKPHSIC